MQNAWLMTALGENRQYAGNKGYEDDPKVFYRYDEDVANHRRVSVGDLAFIRDRNSLIGLALIERIDAGEAEKLRQRCPKCGTTAIKERQKDPKWRCNRKHEFQHPRREIDHVETYKAYYGKSFVEAPEGITATELKQAAVKPADQLSIELLDLRKLERRLRLYPSTRRLIENFVQSCRPEDHDADGDRESDPEDPFAPSVGDQREKVLASIRARRGQRRFREALIRRYSPACMVSGCELLSVVEACHIWPYRGETDNHAANGLLLRADLHTLFDLDLMAIEPESLTVRMHPRAISSGYAIFEGQRLKLPPSGKQPAAEALTRRWECFQQQLLANARGGSLTRSLAGTALVAQLA